jgi:hypothetical protein
MENNCNKRDTLKNYVHKGDMYLTFVFDDVDSSIMGVFAVSDGTYVKNILPSFEDSNMIADGYDGRYYFGTSLRDKVFSFDCFVERLDASDLDELRSWLRPDKVAKLILPEEPFKFYWVKLSAISDLSNIPLVDEETGEALFTGKFSLTFITVGQPIGYGMGYYTDDVLDFYQYGDIINVLPSDLTKYGLLKKQEMPSTGIELTNGITNGALYNPGTHHVMPYTIIKIKEAPLLEGAHVLPEGSFLTIKNKTRGLVTVVDLSGLPQYSEMRFDFQRGHYFLNEDADSSSRVSGDLLQISGRGILEKIEDCSFSLNMLGNLIIQKDPLKRKFRNTDANKVVFLENIANTGSEFGLGGRVSPDIDFINNILTLDLELSEIFIESGEIFLTTADELEYELNVGEGGVLEIDYYVIPRYL